MKNLISNDIQLRRTTVQKVRRIYFILSIAIFSTSFIASTPFAQEVISTITHPGFRPWSLAVYETGDKLFVGDRETGNLLIYDGTSLDLLAELPIDGGSGGSILSVHEASGKVFFGTFPYGYHIAVINAVTNELIEYIEIDTQGQTIDQDLGKIYTIRRYAPFILYSIDAYTHSFDSVELSNAGLTSGLEVNPVTHEVFIGYLQGSALDIVDGPTMGLTTVPGINGRCIVVNWLENKVYGEKGTFDGFWIYDRDMNSMKVCTTDNDANPEIFNPASNRVHTGSEINGNTTIIEGTDDSWFNIPMYSGTTDLGVRHSTNHVYYVGFDYIVVLDGTTLEWLAEIPNIWLDDPSIYDIAINQSTGRVFVSYSDGPGEPNTIVVIQDSAVAIEPDISVSPDTLRFGIPANFSSINTVSHSIYHNDKLQEFPDNEPDRLIEGKKIAGHSMPLSQEQSHSSNLNCPPGKGNLDTLMYDDGAPEYLYSWGNGARMASRMSPLESCKILAIQIFCGQAESYKVGVYDWTGSQPGNQIFETGVVHSFGQGWNTTDISSYNITVDGDFVASFNMIDDMASLGFDTFNNGRAWDYDGASWSAWDETYFIRAIVEYEDETADTVGTITIKNLGNADLIVDDITAGQQWITSIEPRTCTVAPYGSHAVTVTVSTAGLSSGTHYGSLNIFSNDPDENPYLEPVKFHVSVVEIATEPRGINIPTIYYLSQNYPNPFNPETFIEFQLPKKSFITINIYNVYGQLVKALVNREETAGCHLVTWNGKNDHGKDVASGVYLCSMKAEGFILTRKMLFLR